MRAWKVDFGFQEGNSCLDRCTVEATTAEAAITKAWRWLKGNGMIRGARIIGVELVADIDR